MRENIFRREGNKKKREKSFKAFFYTKAAKMPIMRVAASGVNNLPRASDIEKRKSKMKSMLIDDGKELFLPLLPFYRLIIPTNISFSLLVSHPYLLR